MDTPTQTDLWRSVPPEEKLEMLAKAQAAGMLGIFYTVIIASTVAVGFHASWLLWASMVCSPFVFQMVAGKSWRAIRPRAMLEYLAARSAAKRFAFAARADQLNTNLIFKGLIEEVFSDMQQMESLNAQIENTRKTPVWVVLFGDAFVMISEKQGGAVLELAHLISDPFEMEEVTADGIGESSNQKMLKITVKNKTGKSRECILSSKYSAALYVFQKLAQSQRNAILEKQRIALEVRQRLNAIATSTPEMPESGKKKKDPLFT